MPGADVALKATNFKSFTGPDLGNLKMERAYGFSFGFNAYRQIAIFAPYHKNYKHKYKYR